MLELAQNGTSINIMQHMVVIVGLVREPSVIQKNIMQALTPLAFWCSSNRRHLVCMCCAMSCHFDAWRSAMREEMVYQLVVISSVGKVVEKGVLAWYFLTEVVLRGNTPITHMLHRMTQGCVQGTLVVQT